MRIRRNVFVWMAVAMASSEWLLESEIHAYLLGSGSFAANLLPEDANELWMRLLIVGLIMGFGILAEYHSRRQSALLVRLEKLNRLLRFLSEVNQRVQRKRNADELFAGICRAAVDIGGFRFAWVGLPNPQGPGLICAAKHSRDGVYSQAVDKLSVGNVVDCVMAAECMREQQAAFCQDSAEMRCQVDWCAPLVQRGVRSVAAFPLHRGEEVIGTFCVYAGDAGFFHDEEISILSEAADDVSFTLSSIAHEQQRQADADMLKERLAELERFHKAAVVREFRIKELRDEVAALQAEVDKVKGR